MSKVKKVFIATPMYNGMCHGEYTHSLISLLQALAMNGIQPYYRFTYTYSIINIARNVLVKEFLNSECTHILFLDADVTFNAEGIVEMIKQSKDITCGIYPKKEINWNKVVDAVKRGVSSQQLSQEASIYPFSSDYSLIDSSSKELVEVDQAPTGCMLISRNVFEKLEPTTKTARINVEEFDSGIKMFFENYYLDRETSDIPDYIGEDYNFCRLWKQTGGKIYVAPFVHMKHIGNHFYG